MRPRIAMELAARISYLLEVIRERDRITARLRKDAQELMIRQWLLTRTR